MVNNTNPQRERRANLADAAAGLSGVAIPPTGSTVWDIHSERAGVVMDALGQYVQLRPVGGGREWDASPEHVQPMEAGQ